MKALEILKVCRERGQKRAGGISLDEAIAELEALQQPKSCEGCKFNGQEEDIYIFPCDYCVRNYDDRYEDKEQ